ncbi:MAG TPA: xylulokinase [Burkholderiaceae bacterium]|nr:xylulokinase [Burkholderiaceae bacterium]
MITLGIDVGTSAVKVALVGDDDQVVAHASRPLTVSRPQPGFSEQDPEQWWQATCAALDELHARQRDDLAQTAAIGLSGQMHGATLIDARGSVLRPCILWNDGRSDVECAELERDWPALRTVTGNRAMPGFTAPKLRWVRKHEPEIFARTAKVLLPKAWLRWKLCGEFFEDMSDASGTLWLDVGRRRWSEDALAACGLTLEHMPRAVEGSAVAGELAPSLAARWGMPRAPLIAGGGGDNAAGAVAVGAVRPGDAFVSLGTSGVLWATTARFAPNPDHGVHAFCHAVPETWHQMGVLLSAAACLAWWAGVTGHGEAELLAEIDARADAPNPVWFAPYLSGERTPHNDAHVRAGFLGLAADTTRAALTQAVLEGVAYALRDAQDALAGAGTTLHEAALIGGGARSPLWAQIIADVLGITLHQVAESEIGCALGAARLARMAAGAGLSVARAATRLRSFEPRRAAHAMHVERHRHWRRLYPIARDFAH